jgi:anaerobic dimethyl sulfoxide reductase subunit C (anchor subunit)
MSLSYTMSARPVWNTPLLPVYYLANAALLGSLAVTVLASLRKTDGVLVSRLALGGAALMLAVLFAWAVFIPSTAPSFTSVGNYFDPTQPTRATSDPQGVLAGFLTGEYALLFWGGALALGALVPGVLAFLAQKREGGALAGLAGASAACALAGGLCFRTTLYLLGFSLFVFY